jgi:cytochrome c peroxidase
MVRRRAWILALVLGAACGDDANGTVRDKAESEGGTDAGVLDVGSKSDADAAAPPEEELDDASAGDAPDAAFKPFALVIPEGFPEPLLPADNPLSAVKVELGRHLFYDKRLSGNGTQSCASCHRQELAFSDGRAQGLGATGEVHPRSPMPLANVLYLAELTWVNPLKTELADQALVPLFGEAPIELGALGHEAEIFAAVRGDAYYRRALVDAFPEDLEPLADKHITKNITLAVAAFERTLISGDSPYDRFMRGDRSALSDSAQRGMRIFFSEETECFHCHSGFAFTDAVTYKGYAFGGSVPHHNNGLYNLDGQGSYPLDNRGLYVFTGVATDMGAFRTPSLRNVGVTAPYMHDGSIATLPEVIDHYARGGRARSPLTSVLVGGFSLDDQEVTDLVAFLESLTDETFLHDPRFADPWPRAAH